MKIDYYIKRLSGETTRDEYCIVTYGYYQDCTTYGGTYEICGPVYTEVISVSCYDSGGGGTIDSDQPPCELCPNGGGGSTSISAPIPEETITPLDLSPCAEDIVNKIKTGDFGSDVLVSLIREIFDENTDVNITIVEDDLASNLDAEFTNADSRGDSRYDIFYLDGTIKLNSDYTLNATEDWLLATIIHEMIHGYIYYYVGGRNAGYISPEDFDAKFPLFSSTLDGDHEIMANEYVGSIMSILQYNNPSLSDSEAEALSWGGLNGTDAYFDMLSKDKAPSESEISSANNVGRGTSPSSSSTQNPC